MDSSLKTKVKRLLNMIICFIFNLRKYDQASISTLRLSLGWMTATDRRLYFKLLSLRNILISQRPSYLKGQFNPPDPTERRSDRLHSAPPFDVNIFTELKVPFSRTDFLKYSFNVSAAREWNNLPYNIQTAATTDSFKSHLKSFLIKQNKSVP